MSISLVHKKIIENWAKKRLFFSNDKDIYYVRERILKQDLDAGNEDAARHTDGKDDRGDLHKSTVHIPTSF